MFYGVSLISQYICSISIDKYIEIWYYKYGKGNAKSEYIRKLIEKENRRMKECHVYFKTICTCDKQDYCFDETMECIEYYKVKE